MKMIVRIAKWELQKMFYSPIAWIMLAAFAVMSGITFMQIVTNLMRYYASGYHLGALTTNMYAGTSGFYTQIQYNMFWFIPLVTMGLLSKEFNSGSIKLLYSSPVTNAQIVLGKFLSAVCFSLCMTFILLLCGFLGFIYIKDADFAQILTAVLGLFLVLTAYSAIGLFMSSLTSYQIVAAIASFSALFALERIGGLWQDIEIMRNITYWLAVGGRAQSFVQGMIASDDLLYFILVSALFLLFTLFKLKSRRERKPKYVTVSRFVGSFLLIAALGYITTLPKLKVYYDATQTDLNTLTQKSQDVMAKLKGEIEVATYANIFGKHWYFGLPGRQLVDMARYEKYERFYPYLDFNYHLYYAKPVEERPLKSFERRFPGKSIDEALDEAVKIWDVNKKLFKPGTDFSKEIDLKDELNRFVVKISSEDGKTAHLRMFNDRAILPNESQMTAAFKRLTDELLLVGFVKGHMERSVNNFGTRGYQLMAKEKTFRGSLLNNGVDFTECDLNSAVDTNIKMLVIAEAKFNYSDRELKNLNDYIDRGGNMVIAADKKRQKAMNPLVARFGVQFMPGQVVEYNKGYPMDLVTAEFTNEGKKLSYLFEKQANSDGIVVMPDVVGIAYTEKPGFKYIPVLKSDEVERLPEYTAEELEEIKKMYTSNNDSLGTLTEEQVFQQYYSGNLNEDKDTDKGKYKGSWNELETTDFTDQVAVFNPKAGETRGAVTTALALTRNIDGKEQRILILGDADCFSNGELFNFRARINSGNFSFLSGLFYWLSNDEVPIDIRRPPAPDDQFYVKEYHILYLNIFYKFVVPGILLVSMLIIWLRRKAR